MAVLVLTTDARCRARLAGALRGQAMALWCCATLDDTRAALARGGVRALVVEARDAHGAPTDALVHDVRTRWPAVTVLAYVEPGRTPTGDVRALLIAGVHELLLHGADDTDHALRAALAAAEQHCIVDLVHARVRPHVPPRAWAVVDFFLRRAVEPATVEDCARALGVHRKTLGNRLREAGCPPPLVVRAWCRLLVVTRLLEEPGRTVESVSLQLDYPSASALRNQARRFLGMTLTDVGAAGGFARALGQFADAMRGAPTPVVPTTSVHPTSVHAASRHVTPIHAAAARVAPAAAGGAPSGHDARPFATVPPVRRVAEAPAAALAAERVAEVAGMAREAG